MIRLFDTEKNELIKEVRRGTVTAVISDLTIDRNNEFCACASDQGTIHLYKIGEENKKSNLQGLSKLSSFFGSEWSTSQLRVNDSYCKIAILNNKIFAISKSGKYYMAPIEDGQEMKVSLEKDMIAESKNAEEQ